MMGQRAKLITKSLQRALHWVVVEEVNSLPKLSNQKLADSLLYGNHQSAWSSSELSKKEAAMRHTFGW
jgi:hypothetical protein